MRRCVTEGRWLPERFEFHLHEERKMARERPQLTGFMVVRNTVTLGYPFLEAILSVLPICDTFLVSDGYSDDETWPALEKLKAAYPEKIQLSRDRWTRAPDDGAVIAKVSDKVRQRCPGRRCLYLQANEVLPEEGLEALVGLVQQFPETRMFRLPFLNIMGVRQLWFADYRRRLFQNDGLVRVGGDGYDVGFDRGRLLRRPYLMLQHLLHRQGERIGYLPRPFYRYRALFPGNYLAKLEVRREMMRNPSLRYFWDIEHGFAQQLIEKISPADQHVEAFWEEMRAYFDEALWAEGSKAVTPGPGLPRRSVGRVDFVPQAIAHLVGKWTYDLNDSLAYLDHHTLKKRNP